MGELHFSVTVDNADFIRRMDEVRAGAKTTAAVFDSLKHCDLDFSTSEKQLISLNKVMTGTNRELASVSKEMAKMSQEATKALAEGDYKTFDELTNKLTEQREKFEGLTREVEQYKVAISVIESASRLEASGITAKAPQFFHTEQEWQQAENLRNKIAELQDQITKFNGSEDAIIPLRQQLTEAQNDLQGMEEKAQQAASSLGADLGGRAAEASTSLYELNAAVRSQEEKVAGLTNAVNEAATALANLQGSDNTAAVDVAQMRYDALSSSLNKAKTELLNLRAAQTDASANWSAMSAEVNQHDSILVKMLGGQEKYNTIISQLPGPLQSAIGGIQGMTGAAKAFIATPLGAIIAAIIIALQTFKSALGMSAEGQMVMTKITGYLGGALNQVKELLAPLGELLIKAFTDPQQAVKDLWEAIKTNIVNRIKAVGGIFAELGAIISETFSGNWGEAKDHISELTNQVLQLGTGIENVSSKTRQWIANTHQAALKNSELAAREEQLHRDRSKWQIEEEKLNARIQAARTKAMQGDALATKESEKLIAEKYAKLKQFAQEEVNIIKERNSLTTNQQADWDAEYAAEASLERLKAQELQEKRYFDRRSMMMSRSAESAAEVQQRQIEAQQRLADELQRLRDENLKAEIEQMEDATAKRLAAMEADYQARKTALEKEAHDIAKANRKAKVTGAGNDGLTDDQRTELERAKKLNESAYLKQQYDLHKEEAAAMRDYLKEYGTYQQQKLAIAEEYAEKIKKAMSEGERLSLTKEREAEIRKVDINALKAEIDWRGLFSGVGTLVADQLKPMLDRLSDLTKEEGFQNYTLEEQKQIYEWIDELRKRLGVDLKSAFEDVGSATEKYQRALRDEEAAKKQSEEVTRNYYRIIDEKRKAGVYDIDGDLEVKVARESMLSAAETLAQATSNAANALDEVQTSAENARNGMANLVDGLKNLGSGNVSDAVKGIGQIMSAFNGNDGFDLNDRIAKWAAGLFPKDDKDAKNALQKGLQSVGSALAGPLGGEIVGMAFEILDIFKDGIENLLSSLIDTILGAVNGLLNTFLSLDLPIAIGESLMNGMKNIANTLTFGGFSSWFGSRESDKYYERDMERLTASNERLESALNRLNDTMSEASIANAGEIYDRQSQYISDKEANLSEQFYRSAVAHKKNNIFGHGGKDSGSYYLRKEIEADTWKEIASLIGKDTEWQQFFKNASADRKGIVEQFLSLSAADMRKIAEEMPSAWMEITQLLSKGYKDANQYLEEYISLPGQLEEIEEAYGSKLTATTFDSVKDSFKSLLLDMDSGTDDFVSDFEKKLQQAIVNSMMDDVYNARLKKWYESFKEKMSDDSLSTAERDSLKAEYDSIVADALQERDALKSAFGWTGTVEQQSASRGYAAQLSEDTGAEISGRLTAVQEQGYVRNEILSNTYQEVVTLRQMVAARNTMLEDLQDGFFVKALEYLEEISKNSKALNTIRDYIDEIKDKIKDL